MSEYFKKIFKFSNIVIILVIIMNMWFTNRALEAFVITGSEPAILIGAFFGFTTGELFALSSIKKAKLKTNKEKDVNIGA